MKKKSGAADVRPIACGETLRRIVEQAILRKVQLDAVDQLKPLQVGVAVKNAATNIALACSRLLPRIRKDASVGILQIDLRNAFNTVDRAAVLRQVRAKAPMLLPWAQLSLGGRSLLLCRDQRIYGHSGVHQGSLLGPLLFALALDEIIGPICREYAGSDVWPIWYLDDGTIFGPLPLLEIILQKLVDRLPRIGLHLNREKSLIVSTGTVFPISRKSKL